MKKFINFILTKFIPYINRILKKDKKVDKTLIYYSSNLSLSGGLTDRLKGIISVYYLSIITSRKFKIIFNSPFELKKIFGTNNINWKIRSSAKEKKYLLMSKHYNFIDQTDEKIIQSNINNIINDQSKIIAIKINQDYSNFINNKNWGDNFYHLFNYTEFTKNVLNKYSQIFKENHIIGVHARFINLLSDNIESGKILDDELKNKLINKIKLILNKILIKNNKILLCSDSKNFLEIINDDVSFSENIIMIKGNPKHSERNKISTNDLEKISADFLLLAQCSQIFSIVLDDMYPSGFPRYAAKLNNINFKIISSVNN